MTRAGAARACTTSAGATGTARTRPGATASLRVEASRGAAAVAAIEALAAAWGELCDRGGLSPFLRPEWVRAHVGAFEDPAAFLLLTVWREQALCGVLPLVADRVFMRGLRVRRLRAAANHHTLYFDLVCAGPAGAKAVAEALWRFLARWPGWTCLELRDVPADGHAQSLLAVAAAAGERVHRWPSPIQTSRLSLALDSGGEPGFQHTARKFRAELRRTRRRLEEQGPVRFDTLPSASAADLDAFFALEAGGWKGRATGNAILRKPAPVLAFYRELAASAAREGRFTLHRLRCGERTVAMSYSLHGPSSCFPFRWCYDEDFAAYGPGHLLIQEIILDSVRRGETTFGLVGESYEYERKWMPPGRQHQFLYLFAPGLPGRLLHALKSRG